MSTRTLILIAAALALAAGCSAPVPGDVPANTNTNSGQSGPPSDPPSTRLPAELDCRQRGEPCALADVPLEVLERSDAVADDVAERLANGISLDEARQWVADQPDVVDVQSDDTALRFCLAGGRDVWIVTEAALGRVAAVDRTEQAQRSAQHVVGQMPATKRALALAPFKYQFEEFDDAAPVAEILRDTRGYGGRVDLLQNASETDATVGIADFKTWDAYDLVHVSSHGSTICDSTNCTTIVFTGDTYGSAEELLTLTELGVSTARIVGDDRKLFGVGPDFFKGQYPTGLADTLVFFSACETLGIGDNDLAAALMGDRGVYIGWSEPVRSDHALAAAVAFYRHASDHGSTATAAWQTLGTLQVSDYVHDGHHFMAQLLVATDNEMDLRIRESITLRQPGGGVALANGDTVPVVGTPGDGQHDAFDYRIQVDGIPAEDAARAVVHLSVDGLDAPPLTAADGQSSGESSWVLRGELPLGRDVEAGEALDLVAWVELPEGGTSEHTVSAVLGNGVGAWVGQTTATIVGTLTDMTVNVSTTVRFELKSERNGREEYEVAGGTMLWSITGSQPTFDGRCFYGFGPIEVPIVPAFGNRLTIDTTTTPPTYSGFGNTVGTEEIRPAENCGDYAFTTRPRTVWLYTVDAENLTVSDDGNRIDGSNMNSTGQWEWSFTRE